jgi:hypothetical protein
MLLFNSNILLPAGFFNSGDLPGRRKLPETNPAHIELAHITMLPAAFPASPYDSG